jgi:hypothetical protein
MLFAVLVGVREGMLVNFCRSVRVTMPESFGNIRNGHTIASRTEACVCRRLCRLTPLSPALRAMSQAAQLTESGFKKSLSGVQKIRLSSAPVVRAEHHSILILLFAVDLRYSIKDRGAVTLRACRVLSA